MSVWVGLPFSDRSILLRRPEGRISGEKEKVKWNKSEERRLLQRKAADLSVINYSNKEAHDIALLFQNVAILPAEDQSEDRWWFIRRSSATLSVYHTTMCLGFFAGGILFFFLNLFVYKQCSHLTKAKATFGKEILLFHLLSKNKRFSQ